METNELISIIIPVFNRKKMLERAVNSVIQQTHQQIEVLIIDDGSDEDLSFIREMDPRIKYFKTKKRGVSAARNFGIQKSTSIWLAFLDSDDEWKPTMLSEHISYLIDNPEYKISQTEDIWIREGKRVNPAKIHLKSEGDIFDVSLERCMISPSSVIIHSDVFTACGNFDEKILAAEDYELWLRITAVYKIGLLREKLLIRHAGHADQLSIKYPMMDQFRIYGLRKLFKSLTSTKKKTICRKTLLKKCKIVAEGAFKRKKYCRWLYYKFLFRIYNRPF